MSRAVGTLGQGTTKSTVGPIRWMVRYYSNYTKVLVLIIIVIDRRPNR